MASPGIAESEVMTLEETAEYLRLPATLVEQQAQSGLLPGRRIDSHWRFLKAAVNSWLSADGTRRTPAGRIIRRAEDAVNEDFPYPADPDL